MEDAVVMGVLQCGGDFPQQSCGFTGLHRVFADALFEAFARDVFHAEPGHAFGFPDVEDADDGGMVQPRGSLGLAVETAAFLGTGEAGAEQDFDGDDAVERGLSRAVDHAHSTAADFLVKIEAGEAGPRRIFPGGRGVRRLVEGHPEEAARAMAAGERDVAHRIAAGVAGGWSGGRHADFLRKEDGGLHGNGAILSRSEDFL